MCALFIQVGINSLFCREILFLKPEASHHASNHARQGEDDEKMEKNGGEEEFFSRT